MEGSSALKNYLDELGSRGYFIEMTRDVSNNNFKLVVYRFNIIGKKIKLRTRLLDPWIASSELWEWHILREVRAMVEEIEDEEKAKKEKKKENA